MLAGADTGAAGGMTWTLLKVLVTGGTFVFALAMLRFRKLMFRMSLWRMLHPDVPAEREYRQFVWAVGCFTAFSAGLFGVFLAGWLFASP
jgi:hypothetical protein